MLATLCKVTNIEVTVYAEFVITSHLNTYNNYFLAWN